MAGLPSLPAGMVGRARLDRHGSMTHGLETDPLFLLYDVARTIRTRTDQRARHLDMTRAQWVILAWLNLQPGLSQNELAALVEVEPITVARLIDRLQARGFVERRADPSDRRVWRLHLLPASGPALAAFQVWRDALSQRFADILGKEGAAELARMLLDVKAGLQADEQAKPPGKGIKAQGPARTEPAT